jgi:hypothetical protein
MATSLDADGMRAVVQRHSDCEVGHDWEGAIATMVDAPWYEFHPMRLRLTSLEAITTCWERTLSLECFGQPGAEYLSFEEYIGEDSVLHIRTSRFDAVDGTRRETRNSVRYGFDGDKICSEIFTMDDSLLPYFQSAFDEGFMAIPGVAHF